MHAAIISNIPPTGRLEVPHAGQRLEALPNETFELSLAGAAVASIEVVGGDAKVTGDQLEFGTKPGLVTVQITAAGSRSPTSVRFMLAEQAAADWLPKNLDPTRRRLVLRGLSQAPWFDGSKASMMGHSLAEFGA